jgi:hypothetical protein
MDELEVARKMLKNDPLGDKPEITVKDQNKVVDLFRGRGLQWLADEVEKMHIDEFYDFLTNEIYD